MEISENINFQINENGESGTLTLKNSVSIQNAEQLKSALLDAYDCMQYFNINVEEVDVIDLSCIQILFSAFESAKSLKKKITIEGTVPEAFKNDIEKAGFNHSKWFCNI